MARENAYDDLGAAELLEVFTAAPNRLRASLGGLSEDELRARPVAGKWSIHEIVLHLADGEIELASRVRRALAESDEGSEAPSPVSGYDAARWAAELGYADASPLAREEALVLFDALRRATGRLFGGVRGGAWERAVEHPRLGRLTVRRILELAADHGERHLGQILDRRERLGKPLDLPLWLPERLY